MAEEIALAGGGAAEMGGHSSTEGGLTPILAVTNSCRSSICFFHNEPFSVHFLKDILCPLAIDAEPTHG